MTPSERTTLHTLLLALVEVQNRARDSQHLGHDGDAAIENIQRIEQLVESPEIRAHIDAARALIAKPATVPAALARAHA